MRTVSVLLLLLFVNLAYGSVTVIDGNHLKIDGKKHRLAFVEAPGIKASCEEFGIQASCGAAARQALRRIVRGREVTCEALDERFLCFVGLREINAEMIAGGHANASEGAPKKYVSFYKSAKAQRLGLWKGTQRSH